MLKTRFKYWRLFLDNYVSDDAGQLKKKNEDSLPSVEDLRLINVTQRQKENDQRIQHLHDACKDTSLFQNIAYNRIRNTQVFYFSKKYNFNYCKVPKAGSTFWTQTLTLLESGSSKEAQIYESSKVSIHKNVSFLKAIVPLGFSKDHPAHSVLVTRDPYTRLFSAFVDLMYVGTSDHYGKAMRIVKARRKLRGNTFVCANDITFEEFLNYTIDLVHAGKRVDRHWAPIYSMCNPCALDVLAIVKMESFAFDVAFTFKKIGVSNDTFEIILGGLEDKEKELVIPSIVNARLENETIPVKCMDKLERAHRLWTSLQIQGYVQDQIVFPFKHIKLDNDSYTESVINIILKTIKEHPLTTAESLYQRHQALVKAYSGVRKSTINEIKRIYKQDFALFGYSDDPPS